MSKNIKINNVVYNGVPYVRVPNENGTDYALFYEISDATAETGHILTGKSAYGSGGLVNGSMANNGSTSGTISTKEGTVTIPRGYTTGGSVGLSTTRKNAIVSGNIKSGRTILGVSGSSMVVDTTISSGGATASNISTGLKAYVNGALITGTATVPTVSQDGTTKVLTIS